MNRRYSILVVSGVGLALLGLSFQDRAPKILYNPSPSAPIGWYKIVEKRNYERGDLVAAWLPKHAEDLASERGYLPRRIPVIKEVKAVPGDIYCIKDGMLKFGDGSSFRILSTDSQGREMSGLPVGCRSVLAGQYLIISGRVKSSFDSRYFGPVEKQDVLGIAEYLPGFEDLYPSVNREEGGARGPGAQGKIKGIGANPLLKPCLHIEFCSVIAGKLVSEFAQISRGCWDIGSVISRLFSKDHWSRDP